MSPKVVLQTAAGVAATLIGGYFVADQVSPARPPPCRALSAVYLNSGEILIVKDCPVKVRPPLSDEGTWWQIKADDRDVDFVVREEQIAAVVEGK